MVKGLERRDASETNALRSLRSSADIPSATLPSGPGPGATPALPRVNIAETPVQRTLGKFRQYASAAIGEAAAIQQERSALDGQMAHLQGKTFDEVQMGGDKFALQGYRVVEAQEQASALLTAQQIDIAQGGYELEPDQFREQFANRVDGVLAGVQDPRTRELVREQVLRQMPVLVDQQTVGHLEFQEERTFSALTRSIDTISADPTSADRLISFATGAPGTATSGLSMERRQEAVVSGVVKAFSNDNPAAYAILSGEGLFKDLPPAQQQAIRSAKSQFEKRARNTYDADFIQAQDELTRRIETGQLEPQQAMEAYATLLADHDITISQQEAGAVYAQAKDGVRDRKVNTAVATHEAISRGDQDTAITMIIKSLTATESSGNPLATITIEDGRQFGGLLQMGQGRLTDYHRATGGKLYTPEEFRKLPPGEQDVVNRWQVKDILDTITADGLDKYIGKSIKGVTVTYSGLVAVAHLGGKGGLKKFLKTGGQYDPHDGSDTRKGTHLSDYLRKHGNGVELNPAQARRSAAQRMTVLREQAALESFEKTQPQLDALDDAFVSGQLSRDSWLSGRREAMKQFNRGRTMADVKYERSLSQKVAGDAAALLDEKKALAAGVKLESLNQAFEAAVWQFEDGTITREDLHAAQQTLGAGRQEVQEQYGIRLNSERELKHLRAQVARISGAVDKRLEFDAGQAEINAAERSGSLHDLTPALQERALDAHRDRVSQEVQDAVASQAVDPEEVGALFNSKMVDYYAKTGVVDETFERTMNGFFAGGLVDKTGAPRPEYLEAAEQYRELHRRNPAVADKYVRAENRDQLDAVLHNAGNGPLDTAVATIGARSLATDLTSAPRTATTQEFLAAGRTIKQIDANVDKFINRSKIGVAQAILNKDADLQQVLNRSWFDPFGIDDEVNRNILTQRLRNELEDAHSRSPNITSSELVEAAGRRVQERSPIIGGNVVALPTDGPSAGERFFGARSADFTDQAGAIDDAVMDYFRSPAFVEEYPFVNETTFRDFLPDFTPDSIQGSALAGSGLSTTFTGVRPFKMYYNSVDDVLQVQFSLPGSGSFSEAIVLDPALIGREYINNHNAAAAE